MSLESKQSVSFLRLTVAAKRRRARPALIAARRMGRMLLFLLPLAAAGAWALSSPRLAVHQMTVQGLSKVESQWAENGLREFTGRNVVRLDLSAVEARLLEHEWIRSVEIRKVLPDRLVVAVTEHQPEAILVETPDEGLSAHYLGQDGEVIARLPEGAALEGWLIVRDSMCCGPSCRTTACEVGSGRRPVRARALELVRSLERNPSNALRRVREVEVLAAGGFRVELEGLPFSLLLRAETAVESAHLVSRLLPELEQRFLPIQSVDLRFSRRILIKPVISDRGASRMG